MENTVSINENGTHISYTYEELLAHHGGSMPGGVALAFRMLQWVFDEVLKIIPEKGHCEFYSGLGENGRGIIDTVTKVLGVVENESLRLDKSYSLDKSGPFAPGGGRYYFECGCNGTLVKLAVKDGAIPEEFFRCSAEMHRKRTAGEKITPAETAHLQQLRIDLSKAILAADSSDLFVLLEA
ncbi:MAG: hypothetical protein IKA89_08445 [Anaerotignum sp.]|nr:hypothetical protein [Anaerotignum sp.]